MLNIQVKLNLKYILVYFCHVLVFPVDIRERFHMVVLLAVVSMRNLAAFNWDLSEYI